MNCFRIGKVDIFALNAQIDFCNWCFKLFFKNEFCHGISVGINQKQKMNTFDPGCEGDAQI